METEVVIEEGDAPKLRRRASSLATSKNLELSKRPEVILEWKDVYLSRTMEVGNICKSRKIKNEILKGEYFLF
jgi:hypothetical protein